jgi:Na+/H+-dicarboxylate symporter
MATNEILQIVVFSIFFGFGSCCNREYVKPVVNGLDKMSTYHFKMVNYVMNFAPIGVLEQLLVFCR